MKTQTQSPDQTKGKTAEGAKAPVRKKKLKSLRRGSTLKRAAKELSTSGYSRQAQQLFNRGKTAIQAATDWAGTTVKHLPYAARNLNVPDQKAAMDFAEQRPLVVGAVGLGIGLVVGALLPRMRNTPPHKRRR